MLRIQRGDCKHVWNITWRGLLWAWSGAVSAPVLGLLVALPAHYPNNFDTLGHLGLIYLAVGIFVIGALLALRGIRAGRPA